MFIQMQHQAAVFSAYKNDLGNLKILYSIITQQSNELTKASEKKSKFSVPTPATLSQGSTITLWLDCEP